MKQWPKLLMIHLPVAGNSSLGEELVMYTLMRAGTVCV